MSYQQAVKDAADALVRGEDANWELAQLTYENTTKGGGSATYAKWSEDVQAISGRRFAVSTAERYASVWERFSTIVERPTWTEAWYEVVPRDQPEPMRARAAKTHVSEAPPIEVAETVREALKRPEVAQAVVADDESNLAISKARQDYDKDRRVVGEVKDPERRLAREQTEYRDLIYQLVQARNKWFAIAEDAGQWGWDQDRRDELIDAIEGVRGALDSLEVAPDFDAAVQEMMR